MTEREEIREAIRFGNSSPVRQISVTHELLDVWTSDRDFKVVVIARHSVWTDTPIIVDYWRA